MTAGRLKEMAWGLKGARRAVKTPVNATLAIRAALAMAGEELLVVEERRERVRREVLQLVVLSRQTRLC